MMATQLSGYFPRLKRGTNIAPRLAQSRARPQYGMELGRKEGKKFLANLTSCDQRMMQAVLALVITANAEQRLSGDTGEGTVMTVRVQYISEIFARVKPPGRIWWGGP